MNKSAIVNTYKFQTESENYGLTLFETFSNMKYSKEGYGFKNISYSQEELNGLIISRTSTYIYDYDPESSEIVKKLLYIYTEIPFSIIITKKILQIFGNTSSVQQLKSVFKRVVPFAFKIIPFELIPFKFYNHLLLKKIQFEILEISINKFR